MRLVKEAGVLLSLLLVLVQIVNNTNTIQALTNVFGRRSRKATVTEETQDNNVVMIKQGI
jgi:hypothetical protein